MHFSWIEFLFYYHADLQIVCVYVDWVMLLLIIYDYMF